MHKRGNNDMKEATIANPSKASPNEGNQKGLKGNQGTHAKRTQSANQREKQYDHLVM
jgi:hypothetical protein